MLQVLKMQAVTTILMHFAFLEKRAGILKPQVNVEEGEKIGRTRGRQNVAMQAILRRSQEQEVKQVTIVCSVRFIKIYYL